MKGIHGLGDGWMDGGQLSNIVNGMNKMVLDKMNKDCKAKEAIQVGRHWREGGGVACTSSVGVGCVCCLTTGWARSD